MRIYDGIRVVGRKCDFPKCLLSGCDIVRYSVMSLCTDGCECRLAALLISGCSGGGEPRQRGARESAHGGWSAAEGGGAASGLPGCIARHWQARGAYAASMIEGLAGATLHAMSHLDGDEA